MIKVLECSSKGDKRFSAFYARIKVNGVEKSIEEHYQLSKRIGNFVPKSWRDVKGKKVTHFVVKNKEYDCKYLTMWYKLLWIKYLSNNPELVEYAKDFNRFSDMFRGKAINCQADIIRDYVKHGRESVFKECLELVQLMKS